MQDGVRGHNNVQRVPLIQLPARAGDTGTRRRDYEIHGRPWGLKLRPLSGCHSPDVATKLSTIDELDRISGERPGNSTPAPSGCS